MREIKFRLWNTFEDEWLYIDLNDPDTFNHLYPHSEDVLYQHTGLKDKNGKEIYEGDIVRYEGPGGPDSIKGSANPFVVEWREGELLPVSVNRVTIIHFHNWTSTKFFEVIGNIYENPGLFKG